MTHWSDQISLGACDFCCYDFNHPPIIEQVLNMRVVYLLRHARALHRLRDSPATILVPLLHM
ncbi:hypothetical protein M404DRAFT_1007363 [Pisolithus tinctorius Marx 270]|uniref:Uncharacterized protein n=1 Tax=Pisolithus tinctorius Marx 270 TaxID=870435 RepID=A0A0C3JD26_PISTI|nr:hypothetical protein M404DRAFT_1007363 [Pisolithus tinctorius Marx 270]